MLDQTFTTENFRRIYDRENRKGVNFEERFFPELAPHTEAAKGAIAALREAKAAAGLTPTDPQKAKLAELKTIRDQIKETKNAFIDELLSNIAERVRSSKFKIDLSVVDGPGGKPVYPAQDSPENFFVLKQLQQNLYRLYRVRQASRYQVSSQLKDVLSNSFNWFVVRTDVQNFYESIDRDALLRKISSDQLLSTSSKVYIRQILSVYGSLSGQAVGIPRGVGISAYLAELYMRAFDEEIRAMDGVAFYGRYVDDIVVVFSRNAATDVSKLQGLVTDRILGLNLTPHPVKTTSYPVDISTPANIEYLGYKFAVAGGTCAVRISHLKILRYRRRLELSFESYNHMAPRRPKRAYRLLVGRVRFLTGNTRLTNNKRHALTGIFFNHSAVTDPSDLAGLDAYLKHLVGGLSSASLKARLAQYSFKQGFTDRIFHNFTVRELSEAVEAWKHAA